MRHVFASDPANSDEIARWKSNTVPLHDEPEWFIDERMPIAPPTWWSRADDDHYILLNKVRADAFSDVEDLIEVAKDSMRNEIELLTKRLTPNRATWLGERSFRTGVDELIELLAITFERSPQLAAVIADAAWVEGQARVVTQWARCTRFVLPLLILRDCLDEVAARLTIERVALARRQKAPIEAPLTVTSTSAAFGVSDSDVRNVND